MDAETHDANEQRDYISAGTETGIFMLSSANNSHERDRNVVILTICVFQTGSSLIDMDSFTTSQPTARTEVDAIMQQMQQGSLAKAEI